MNIAEKLVKLRKEQGLTQENLSKELNISISAIRNYENIKSPREPKNDMLLKFAKFYNVSTEYLLNDEITNKTTDNITIENKLNLSDKTIEKIVEINTKVNSEIIGKFIDYMSISEFWNKINEYKKIGNEINILLPTLQIRNDIKLLERYSTNDTIDNYMLTENDEGGTYDIEKFFNKNLCQYVQDEKQQLLQFLDKIKSNKVLIDYEGCPDFYFPISIIYSCITNNAKIPFDIGKQFVDFLQEQISTRKERKEIIGFYLSKELNNFLTYLDKEEQEAE